LCGRLSNGGSTMTVEKRLEQLEKRNKRLTVALTMMAVAAITIQFSACGDDCDVSDVKALAGRDLTQCDLKGANLFRAYLDSAILVNATLEGANLRGAYLEGAINVPELSAKQ
jgi:hypothetical protein